MTFLLGRSSEVELSDFAHILWRWLRFITLLSLNLYQPLENIHNNKQKNVLLSLALPFIKSVNLRGTLHFLEL